MFVTLCTVSRIFVFAAHNLQIGEYVSHLLVFYIFAAFFLLMMLSKWLQSYKIFLKFIQHSHTLVQLCSLALCMHEDSQISSNSLLLYHLRKQSRFNFLLTE